MSLPPDDVKVERMEERWVGTSTVMVEKETPEVMPMLDGRLEVWRVLKEATW